MKKKTENGLFYSKQILKILFEGISVKRYKIFCIERWRQGLGIYF